MRHARIGPLVRATLPAHSAPLRGAHSHPRRYLQELGGAA